MCRLFAYISSTEPCLLSDVLLSPANAITKQVSNHYLPQLLPYGHYKDLHSSTDSALRLRNHLLNFDGFGIAWYTNASSAYTSRQTGARPALYKSQSPPTNDFNLNNLCENTESTCVFAHIRATSGSAVTPVNCHPFVFGRHVFMHNGLIGNFSRIRRVMMGEMAYDAYENIKGSTDTEHVAALYMTFLCGVDAKRESWQQAYSLDAMAEALRKTIVRILEIQRDNLPANDHTASALNICVTDGTQMVATRFLNMHGQEPASLYWSESAGRKLNRKYPGLPDGLIEVNLDQVVDNQAEMGLHTIVASEPTTFDEAEWKLIGRNCMLLVGGNGAEREVRVLYDAGLDAMHA